MKDDLYVTGDHMVPIFKDSTNSTVKYVTTAHLHPKFSPVSDEKIYIVYNLVLTSDKIDEIYSIYANGFLCESMSYEAYKNGNLLLELIHYKKI